MTRYLLDTNIISYLVDSRSLAHRRVRARLGALADEDEVTVSILTLYELHHWLAHDEGRRTSIDAVLAELQIEPLRSDGAVVFGQLARRLRAHHGKTALARLAIDAMIAASAIVAGSVLVSSDGVFLTMASVDGRIRLEDWSAVPGQDEA